MMKSAKGIDRRVYLQLLAIPLISLLLFWQFWTSAYTADDSPNRLLRFWTVYDYGERGFTAWLRETQRWTLGWMDGQGRFFPTAVALNRGIFLMLESRVLYKILQFLLVFALVALVSIVVSKILKSREMAPIAAIITLGMLQIRFDYDPYFSFSLLLTSTACLLLIIFLCMEKFQNMKENRRKYIMLILIAQLSFLAFTNYEYSIVLVPAILLLLFQKRENLWKKELLVPALVVSMLAAAIVSFTFFILRPKRENKIPSYEFSLELVPFLKAFFAQVLSPIPFLPHIFLDIQIDAWQPAWVLALLFLTFFALLPHKRLRIVYIDASNLRALFLSGAYLILAPSILVAITRRWQLDNALTIGKSYLPVIFVAIGYVFVISGLLVWLSNQFHFQKTRRVLRPVKDEAWVPSNTLFDRAVSSLVIAVFFWVSSSHNLTFFGDGRSQDKKLEILEIAANSGIFDSVKDGDRLISWEMNDATEINRAVLSVLGNKDLSMLNQPRDILPEGCAENRTCDPYPVFKGLSLTQNRLIGESREDISRPSNFHILDVIFYLTDAAVFSISPIRLTNEKVIVDRAETRVVWVVGRNSRLLGRVIGNDTCVLPKLQESSSVDHWDVFVQDTSVSDSYELLSAIDRGRTCDEVQR